MHSNYLVFKTTMLRILHAQRKKSLEVSIQGTRCRNLRVNATGVSSMMVHMFKIYIFLTQMYYMIYKWCTSQYGTFYKRICEHIDRLSIILMYHIYHVLYWISYLPCVILDLVLVREFKDLFVKGVTWIKISYFSQWNNMDIEK